MARLDRSTLDEIISILEPELRDEAARRAYFDLVFAGMSARPDLDLSGASHQATMRMVMTLHQFGTIASNTPALWALCEAIMPRIGTDRQARLEALREAIFEGPEASAAVAQPSEPPARDHVFVSYSRQDRAFVEQLTADLQAAGINVWIDRSGLKPGTRNWENALRAAIRDAFALLLVASPLSRQSNFVQAERDIAAMYGLPLLPVWAVGEHWIESAPMTLSRAQYVDMREPTYATNLPALIEHLRALGAASDEMQAEDAPVELRNPYKGLRAFKEADSEFFFGREALVEELLALLDSQRFLTLVGGSGSGKSSVIMAGVLPRLREREHWHILPVTVPGIHPLETLALLFSDAFNMAISDIRKDLDNSDGRGLHLLADRLARREQAERLVLYVDQFEETFTLTTSEDERRQFIDLLVKAVNEPRGTLTVIVTLRADFYDRPLNYPELGKLVDAHSKSILQMTVDDLRSAIEQPAARVGLGFEDGLVGDLLFEVRDQAGALPLLQFTLDLLYRQCVERDGGRLLSRTAYRALGGVRGALAQHAEATYAALPTEQHRLLTRVLFLRLVETGATEQETARRRARRADLTLADSAQTVVLSETTATFVDARLLVTDGAGEDMTVEVSHEALIREWQRLSNWLIEGREDIRLQNAVAQDTADWVRVGKRSDDLYRGARLLEAREWARRGAPSADEQAFIDAGVAYEADLVAQEEHRKEELLDAEQRASAASQEANRTAVRAAHETNRALVARRLAGVVGIVGVLILIAAAVSVINAQNQVSSANTTLSAVYPTSTAIADQLIAGTLRIRALDMLAAAEQELNSGNAFTATLLGVRSLQFAQTDDAAAVLERSLRMNYAAWYVPESALDTDFRWSSNFPRVEFSRDGQNVIVGGDDGIYILDMETGKLRLQHVGEIAGFDDDSVIATMTEGNRTTLTNIETDQIITTLSGANAIYSPMRHFIATLGAEDETAYTYVWDAASGNQIARIEGTNPIFNPDERFVLVSQLGGNNSTLWSLESDAQLFEAAGDAYSVYSFSPDSKHFVTLENNQVDLWNVESQDHLELLGHEDTISSVSFSPDSSKLVTTAGQYLTEHRDSTAVVWDVATGARLFTLRGQEQGFNDAIFSPDGSFIVTTSYDGRAIVWDANTGEQKHILAGHSNYVLNTAISPDNRYIATVGGDGVMLWDLNINNSRLLQLNGNAIHATNAEFSPDGRFIITSSVEVTGVNYDTNEFDNNKAVLWNAQDGTRVRVLGNQVDWATFDREGASVAVSDAFWHNELINSYVTSSADDFLGSPRGGTPRYSASGRYLYTIEGTQSLPSKGTARIYDAATLNYITEVNYFDGEITSASISPDDTILATATDDGKIVIWSIPSGSVLTYLFPGTDLTRVVFSPDGSRLVASEADGSVTLWDVKTWQIERQFIASAASVNDVAFSPDGSLLATAGAQSGGQAQAILWDTLTWKPVRSYYGHSGSVLGINFNADGTLVITAGADATVQVWNSSYEELIAYACERLTHLRDLTVEERQRVGASPLPSCEKLDVNGARAAAQGKNRGAVALGQSELWRYTGRPGDVISVGVYADHPAHQPDDEDSDPQGLDAFVSISDPDFNTSVTNDDIESGVNTDSLIKQFALTKAGDYIIIVSGLDNLSAGDYTLDIEPVSLNASPAPNLTLISYVHAASDFNPQPNHRSYPGKLAGINQVGSIA